MVREELIIAIDVTDAISPARLLPPLRRHVEQIPRSSAHGLP